MRVFAGVLVAVAVAVADGGGVLAHEDHDHAHTPAVAWPDALYLPTPFPDRICLSITADAAHEIAVTWRTDQRPRQAVWRLPLRKVGLTLLAKRCGLKGPRRC